ncbi:MAG: carboxypeptidase regulatory-like domain-containing protein [Bryobacteraceae bacterium]|nr:carboxypeptidase regulatory-like domain-containing protein [Bryobacteraceae bacterium]
MAGLASAQITGDIFVSVSDKTGAVIPNATVVVKSVETGASRTLQTATDGAARFTLLAVGRYEVTVTAPGFASAKSDAAVNSGAIQELKYTLEVSQTRQEVVVSDSTVAINTVSAQLQTTTDNREVMSLPVNTSTAGVLTFAATAPGVIPMTPQDNNGFLGYGNYNANGGRGRGNNITVDNATATDVSTTGGAGLGTVPLDAVQEVNFITNNFSAEFGRNSSSQYQILTKSGTNEFHGTAAWFFRNAALNARDYFDRTGRATPLRDNRWWVTGGGRIIKDKLFYFGTYEENKVRGAGGTATAIVPTPAQVAGITDPTSRSLFQNLGGVTSPSGSITVQGPNLTDQRAFSGKMNWNINDRNILWGRVGVADITSQSFGLAFISSFLPGNGAQLVNRDTNATINYTSILSPRMTFNFLGSFGRSRPDFAPTASNVNTFVAFGDGTAGLGVWNGLPQGRTQNTYQYLATTTYTTGKHTLKGGYELNRVQANSYFDAVVRGTWTFPTFADFQAGRPLQYQQRFGNSVRGNRVWNHFFFLQDDWRVSRTLTVNLGLRYEAALGATEVNGLLSNLDLALRAPMGGGGTGPLGAVRPVERASNTQHNWAPRVGFAWNPGNGRTAIRGGYGIAYDFLFLNPITNLRFAPPFMYLFTLLNFTGADSYANVFNGSSQFQRDGAAAVGTFPNFVRSFGGLSPVDFALRNPQTHQWNLTVEREVGLGMVARVGYVGTKGNFLQRSRPINTISPALLRPATSPADEQARLAEFRALNAGLGAAPTAQTNRIDPRFAGVTLVESSANSNFHSFQASLQKRFSKGLMFNAAYTWSKSIDDVSDVLGVLQADSAGQQNPFNNRDNRAVSAFDVPHRFVLSHVWDLPWFNKSDNRLLRHTLGGWQFSGIFQVQSGLPQLLLAGARLGIVDGTLLGGGGSQRPDLVGPLNVAFQPDPGAGRNNPNLITNSGLAQPLLGNFGTLGRNVVRENGLTNFDWTFGKTIPITERVKTMFQAQVFNVFNNTSFTGAGRDIAAPTRFGYYNQTNTVARNITLNLRVIW